MLKLKCQLHFFFKKKVCFWFKEIRHNLTVLKHSAEVLTVQQQVLPFTFMIRHPLDCYILFCVSSCSHYCK